MQDFGDPAILEVEDPKGAHLLGNEMNEAIMLPGKYKLTAVTTESIAPSHAGKDRDPDRDFKVYHLQRIGDAQRGDTGGAYPILGATQQ
jgi:hypothetical protein